MCSLPPSRVAPISDAELVGSLLEDYAEENGYTFFDISDYFKDETGALDYTYDAGDGLHFNQTFYHTYLELLTTEMPAAAA